MAILFNEKEGIFHLQAGDSSYVMKLYKKGYLSHVYWGKRLRSSNLSYALRTIKGVWETNHDPEDKTYSLDLLPMEYPSYGSTDLRHPAYQARLETAPPSPTCGMFHIKFLPVSPSFPACRLPILNRMMRRRHLRSSF